MSIKARLQRITIICFAICTLTCLLSVFYIDSSSAASYGNNDAAVIISEDGSIEGTNLLQRSGNVYTLISDIIISQAWSPAGIQVLKDNIIIDGAGHSITINGEAMRGLDLSGRSGIIVKNLRIEGFNQGIYLDGSTQTTIQNNVIVGSNGLTSCGVWVNLSPNNKIVGNTISTGKNSSAIVNYGILIQADSTSNLIEANTIKDSQIGISLSSCQDNTLRNNQLIDNTQGLTVGYSSIETQDIDTSNRIDGNPIYYWINQQDRAVPSDAGFVALGNCKNIDIKDLKTATCILFKTRDSTMSGSTLSVCAMSDCQSIEVTKNTFTGNGIRITSCDNLKITENNLSDCGDGITASSSKNILISGNKITNCNAGLSGGLKESTITHNYFADNTYGINAVSCSGNVIVENTFIENKQGALRLSGSNNNTLYHNDFIHNTDGCQIFNPWIVLYVSESNVWDNGFEGNYWSDLKSRFPDATQNLATGLWDTAYYINSQNYDRYPLINQYVCENSVSPTVEPSSGQTVSSENNSRPLFLLSLIFIVACVVLALTYLFIKGKRQPRAGLTSLF